MRGEQKEAPNVLIDNDYETLVYLLAVQNLEQSKIGTNGSCRFCGKDDRKLFRNEAHTFPEGLGNKWFFSQDECDQCNTLFSAYDDALCKSVGALLTILGVKGKGNKVRQTGRSSGSHNIKYVSENTSERAVITVLDVDNNVKPPTDLAFRFFEGRQVSILVPTPIEVFVPRYAYKCLVKMALAIMPETELHKFECLKTWLLNKDDDADFPFLDVGLSIRTEFDVEEMMSATLLKRKSPNANLPYMIFVFCVGPICWQIDLLPDHEDENCGLVFFGFLNLSWALSFSDQTGCPKEIGYPRPIHMDWRSRKTVPVPISNVTPFINENKQVKYFVSLRKMEP
jgi:hypothetical protein